MSESTDLTIEEFARLCALARARGEEALPAEVRIVWQDISRALNARIESDLAGGSRQLAIAFAGAYRPALAALRGAVTPPERSRDRAAEVDAAVPSYLLTNSIGVASASPGDAHGPSSLRGAILDTTAEIDAQRVESPAFPFHEGGPSSLRFSSPPAPVASTGTVEIDASVLRAEIFPFQNHVSLDESASRPPASPTVALTVEAFASLKAELICAPARAAQILARYRISESDFEVVCERWGKAHAEDPTARRELQSLVDGYVAFLQRRT